MNALPSPKPNRRKRPYGRPLLGRLALRFAVLVAAASVLYAAYWFTRPPELVWSKRVPFDDRGHYVRFLIPFGWEKQKTWGAPDTICYFRVTDSTPALIRGLFRNKPE